MRHRHGRRASLVVALLAVATAAQTVVEIAVTPALAHTGGASACSFSPTSVRASVGDALSFAFAADLPTATTTTTRIVQGRADTPCVALSNGLVLDLGADARVQVNSSEPLFFHCASAHTPTRCARGSFVTISVNAEFGSESATPAHALFAAATQTEPPDSGAWQHVWAIIVGVAGGITILLVGTCCGCWCICGRSLVRRHAALARAHGISSSTTAIPASPQRARARYGEEVLPAYEPRRDAGVQVPAYDESAPAYVAPPPPPPVHTPPQREGEDDGLELRPIPMPMPMPAVQIQIQMPEPAAHTTSQPRAVPGGVFVVADPAPAPIVPHGSTPAGLTLSPSSSTGVGIGTELPPQYMSS